MYMKAIQITFDERLLARLDATEEAQRDGRSAVMRRAVEEYLRRRHRCSIAEQYKNAYGTHVPLGNGFEGWEDQGEWPSD